MLSRALAAFTCLCAAYAAPVLAQTEALSHRVPAGSTGNALELAVANTAGETVLHRAVVRLDAAPDWLAVSPEAVVFDGIAPGEEAMAAFRFDVAEGAAAGTRGEVRFVVEGPAGQAWTKTVALEVEAPQALVLEAAYPNPFRSSVTLAYRVAAPAHVRLAIYDVLGREVVLLTDGPVAAGRQTVRWEAASLASGVYLYRLEAVDAAGRRTVRQQQLARVR